MENIDDALQSSAICSFEALADKKKKRKLLRRLKKFGDDELISSLEAMCHEEKIPIDDKASLLITKNEIAQMSCAPELKKQEALVRALEFDTLACLEQKFGINTHIENMAMSYKGYDFFKNLIKTRAIDASTFEILLKHACRSEEAFALLCEYCDKYHNIPEVPFVRYATKSQKMKEVCLEFIKVHRLGLWAQDTLVSLADKNVIAYDILSEYIKLYELDSQIVHKIAYLKNQKIAFCYQHLYHGFGTPALYLAAKEPKEKAYKFWKTLFNENEKTEFLKFIKNRPTLYSLCC